MIEFLAEWAALIVSTLTVIGVAVAWGKMLEKINGYGERTTKNTGRIERLEVFKHDAERYMATNDRDIKNILEDVGGFNTLGREIRADLGRVNDTMSDLGTQVGLVNQKVDLIVEGRLKPKNGGPERVAS